MGDTEPVIEKDHGPRNVYRFLDRTGFLDSVANSEKFKEWMQSLDFADFESHITRINGLVRQAHTKERHIYDKSVIIQNQTGIKYIPPNPKDKRSLLEKSFESSKRLPEKDAGLLIYYALQKIHPFPDGNGRTGRLLYVLLEKGSVNQKVSREELEDFLAHDGDSGPGRDSFGEKVNPPEKVDPVVERLLASQVLGEEVTNRFRLTYSGLLMGTIEPLTNQRLTKETKSKLERLMSESGGGSFAFRNTVLLKYTKDKGTYNKYTSEDLGKEILRLDGQKILEDLTEEESKEVMDIYFDLKKKFVEKLIDVIVNAQDYPMPSGGTIKDNFFYKNSNWYG